MKKIIILTLGLLCTSGYAMNKKEKQQKQLERLAMPSSLSVQKNDDDTSFELLSKKDVLQVLTELKQDESFKNNAKLQDYEQKIENLPKYSARIRIVPTCSGNASSFKYAGKNYYDLNSFAIVGCSLLTGFVVWYCMRHS